MISFILAMDRNRLIGAGNKLPWHMPGEMAYFRRVTTGHIVLMGRKTFESIGKPLPKRDNWVLTRDKSYRAEGCRVLHSAAEAAALARAANDEVFVIGGTEVFVQLMPYADRLYITHIDHAFEGDTYFPRFDESEWRLIRRTEGTVDEKTVYPHLFCVYERIPGGREGDEGSHEHA